MGKASRKNKRIKKISKQNFVSKKSFLKNKDRDSKLETEKTNGAFVQSLKNNERASPSSDNVEKKDSYKDDLQIHNSQIFEMSSAFIREDVLKSQHAL